MTKRFLTPRHERKISFETLFWGLIVGEGYNDKISCVLLRGRNSLILEKNMLRKIKKQVKGVYPKL